MKIRGILLFFALALLWPGNVLIAESFQERKLGSLTFAPYEYKIDGQSIACELGRLVVKENRSNPNSNLIELAFVRLKSTRAMPGPPTIYLEGGPGASAISAARIPEYMRAFAKVREVGDVILLDQRGVGFSRPNLTRVSSQSLPLDFFADQQNALRTLREGSREAACPRTP